MCSQHAAPTLDDVAKLAKVSTATVSRCLNSPDRVVESTRLRVMEAVKALGYTPNFGARVMAAKRTFTIGAIIPTMDNSIFARGLQAFQEGLHEQGYTLLVASSAYKPEIEEEQIKALVARGADGLLLIGHERDPAIYEYLRQQKVPVLISWSYNSDTSPASVGFDNRKAMKSIAEHVIACGHRKIGVISAHMAGNDRAQSRVLGVRDAANSHGLDGDVIPVVETTYEVESGAAALRELLERDQGLTAVICGNDVLAAGAMRAAKEMGKKVPDDISFTGFDDMELARIVEPPMTSVHVPHGAMGQMAAREIIKMVEGKSDGNSFCLETSVVQRGSVYRISAH